MHEEADEHVRKLHEHLRIQAHYDVLEPDRLLLQQDKNNLTSVAA